MNFGLGLFSDLKNLMELIVMPALRLESYAESILGECGFNKAGTQRCPAVLLTVFSENCIPQT